MITARNILVAIPFTPDQQRAVRAAADIIMGNLPPRQLTTHGRRVQWVQLASAGADSYSVPGILRPKTLLTNSVGAYGQAVAEHMVAMTLACMKKLPQYRDNQRGHVWEDCGGVTSLDGAHVLILGLGDIGTHFARMVSGFGAHVVGTKRQVPATSAPLPTGVERIITMADLHEELPHTDVVVSFLPGGPSTHHLLDADFFALLQQGAYFLNGGRGTVVDPDALRTALVRGSLAGAGLDVTSPEPLPAEDSLWDMPNVLITPHVAGGYHLPVVLDNVAEICSSNLRSFLAGKPLRNIVRHETTDNA